MDELRHKRNLPEDGAYLYIMEDFKKVNAKDGETLQALKLLLQAALKGILCEEKYKYMYNDKKQNNDDKDGKGEDHTDEDGNEKEQGTCRPKGDDDDIDEKNKSDKSNFDAAVVKTHETLQPLLRGELSKLYETNKNGDSNMEVKEQTQEEDDGGGGGITV